MQSKFVWYHQEFKPHTQLSLVINNLSCKLRRLTIQLSLRCQDFISDACKHLHYFASTLTRCRERRLSAGDKIVFGSARAENFNKKLSLASALGTNVLRRVRVFPIKIAVNETGNRINWAPPAPPTRREWKCKSSRKQIPFCAGEHFYYEKSLGGEIPSQ